MNVVCSWCRHGGSEAARHDGHRRKERTSCDVSRREEVPAEALEAGASEGESAVLLRATSSRAQLWGAIRALQRGSRARQPPPSWSTVHQQRPLARQPAMRAYLSARFHHLHSPLARSPRLPRPPSSLLLSLALPSASLFSHCPAHHPFTPATTPSIHLSSQAMVPSLDADDSIVSPNAVTRICLPSM